MTKFTDNDMPDENNTLDGRFVIMKGDLIKELRLLKGWNKTLFCVESGVKSTKTITRAEQGKPVTYETAVSIASALDNIDVKSLLAYKNKTNLITGTEMVMLKIDAPYDPITIKILKEFVPILKRALKDASISIEAFAPRSVLMCMRLNSKTLKVFITKYQNGKLNELLQLHTNYPLLNANYRSKASNLTWHEIKQITNKLLDHSFKDLSEQLITTLKLTDLSNIPSQLEKFIRDTKYLSLGIPEPATIYRDELTAEQVTTTFYNTIYETISEKQPKQILNDIGTEQFNQFLYDIAKTQAENERWGQDDTVNFARETADILANNTPLWFIILKDYS